MHPELPILSSCAGGWSDEPKQDPTPDWNPGFNSTVFQLVMRLHVRKHSEEPT